jgi:elongation factor P--(R)-beta-lysine ligase
MSLWENRFPPLNQVRGRLSGDALIRAHHTDPEPNRHIFRRIFIDKVMAKTPPITPAASPFWAADVHADRRPFLLARNRIVAALRAYFEGEDFVEVDTGALQVSPGNEIHLHAFATTLAGPDGASRQLYLRTSPEFACKKLLAAGEPRIVEFAKVFRNRERGALHHPEFTLIEWYRAGEPYERLMSDCAAILALAAKTA